MCSATAKLSVASIRPMQHRSARLGCGRSPSGSMRTVHQRMAMSRHARLRWQRSPRGGAGNRPALPFAWPPAGSPPATGLPPDRGRGKERAGGLARASRTLPGNGGREASTRSKSISCEISGKRREAPSIAGSAIRRTSRRSRPISTPNRAGSTAIRTSTACGFRPARPSR